MKKGLAPAAALLVFGALVMMNGMGLGAPAGMPLISIGPTYVMPTPTLVPAYTGSVDAVVNIPDSDLKASLQAALNMTPQSTLRRSDLAKIHGGLDLSNKGITKLEGLQYCVNVTDLILSKNKITDAGIPTSLSSLTNLRTLMLDSNKLTKVPKPVLSMTGLTYLSLANNEIKSLPDNIEVLSSLQILDLSRNKLSSLPAHIGLLSNLQYLNLSGNSFRKSPPKEISLLLELHTLDLSNNTLDSIPIDYVKMPTLTVLNIEGNIISSLPAGIGNTPSLLKVYAARNRLTEIEPSLLNGKITDLALDVNRLKELPQTLTNKSFNTFSVEWNFIDMSEGSESRQIAESVTASAGKAYLRQLKSIETVQTKPSINTVLLQWQPLTDGSDGDCSWKVAKYQIYRVKGETWSLAGESDRLGGHFVVTGLEADKDYTFQVGVEYSLSLGNQKAGNRYFTPVEARTLSADATVEVATPPPTESPDEQMQEPPPDISDTEQPWQTSTPATTTRKGGNTGLAIALIIISALFAIGVLVVVALMMSRRRRRSY